MKQLSHLLLFIIAVTMLTSLSAFENHTYRFVNDGITDTAKKPQVDTVSSKKKLKSNAKRPKGYTGTSTLGDSTSVKRY